MMSEKFMKVTTGLLVTTIISGYVVSKFAPRVGMTIAWTSYLLAGATSLASAVCAFKEI